MVITGTGFTGVTAVEFGSTDARSFTVTSPTSITAVSPAGTTGEVDVIVRTPNGSSASSAKDRFTFEAPTVQSVSPDSGPTTGGTAVTITGSGFALGTGTTTFKFAKELGTSVHCTSSTSCTVVAPSATRASTVDVRATVNAKTSKKIRPGDQFTYN